MTHVKTYLIGIEELEMSMHGALEIPFTIDMYLNALPFNKPL
jgi:hypothetical protein